LIAGGMTPERAAEAAGLRAPGFAHTWSEGELRESLNFWSQHALSDGRGIDPRELGLPATVARSPRLDAELRQTLAANEPPYLDAQGRQHIMEGEVTAVTRKVNGEPTTVFQLEGGHHYGILQEILGAGTRQQPGGRFFISGTQVFTLNGQKIKKADGKANLSGLLQANRDGTFSVQIGMNNPADPTRPYIKSRASTFFPMGWEVNHIDAAARVLSRAEPEQRVQNANGTERLSFFGLFPRDPTKPIGEGNPPFSAWLIVDRDPTAGAPDKVITFYPTGGEEPARLRPD